MAAREEYSSAATPVSLGRGLIFFWHLFKPHRQKGKECCRGPYLRDQKIPTITEALRPLTSVSNSSLS